MKTLFTIVKQSFQKNFRQFKDDIKAELSQLNNIRAADKYLDKKDLKLHLACGETYKKGWINIDISSYVADLLLDLTKKLPFADNSCCEVYCEHFFEHISYPIDAENFLNEIFRVLQPNGKLTIVVPDTVWPMRSYFEGYNAKYFKTAKKKNWHPFEYSTRIEHINFHFRQNGEHLYAYDEELLKKLFQKAGFIDFKTRKFNPKIDRKIHHPGSIYSVGIKK